jgi:hypothetical protein
MPKEEQNYWYSLKSAPESHWSSVQSAPDPLTMKKYEIETPDVEALQNENARLRKQLEELQAPKLLNRIVVEK